MAYFAYMIRSVSTGKYYYGYTSDLEQRIKSHNTSQNRYTRQRGPWILVGFFQCETKTQAIQIEHRLKKMKSSKKALQWLATNGSA